MSEDFKARMKRIRIRAGFGSQQAAAEAIGCPRGTVGMWEAPSSPVQSIGNEWLFEVARAYRVHPAWINKLDSVNDGFPWQPLTAQHLAASTEEISPSFARLLTAANVDPAEPMTQASLARALGVSPSTVSAWRSSGVSKDGAEFAEQKFSLPAEWILFGTGLQLGRGSPSQPARLDAERLAMLMEAVDNAAAGVWTGEPRSKALLVAALYMDGQVTPETAAVTARAALNGLLASHRGMRESTVKG